MNKKNKTFPLILTFKSPCCHANCFCVFQLNLCSFLQKKIKKRKPVFAGGSKRLFSYHDEVRAIEAVLSLFQL